MSGSGVDAAGRKVEATIPRGPDDLAAPANHPLTPWRPLLRDLALGLSREDERVLVLRDARGDIVWVDGEPASVDQAHALGLAPGIRWTTWADALGVDGTSASIGPGWGCWASPVFDPCTEDLLAVLALCGPTGTPDTLLLARAVARLAEELVRRDRLRPPPGDRVSAPTDRDAVHLRVLGPGPPTAEVAGATVVLTPRRADLLFLLARHPDGLSADALAQELYGDAGNPLTVRVEVHRIRALLGPRLASAPYRFSVPVTSDADAVLRLLASDRIDEAVLRYTGPLLPRSESLEIEQLRAELHQVIRAAALRAGGTALADWCGHDVGEGDAEALGRYADTLSPLDPMRLFVKARLARLDVGATAPCNPRATSATGHWPHG